MKYKKLIKFLPIAILCIVLFTPLYLAPFILGKKDLPNFPKPSLVNFLPSEPKEINLKLLFTGDIFWGRYMNQKANNSELGFKYPFSKLDTLERQNYDAWIGNLECPVTVKQATLKESEVYLRLTCRPEYLEEFKKYFDIVSLANNHTDNMEGNSGLFETRQHLDKVGIEYFGNFNNALKSDICEIIEIKNLPIAFCGYHGVYKLPTDDELAVIKEYSKYFLTIVMPHQGEEYKFTSNSFQKKVYRQMIDNGADVVIAAHPHVIEEVEEYKGKLIFYSLGNFIFDQRWVKAREHMVVDMELSTLSYKDEYNNYDCNTFQDNCLEKAKNESLIKPKMSLKYKPIFTFAKDDNITYKLDLTEGEYLKEIKTIGFDKVASSSKQ